MPREASEVSCPASHSQSASEPGVGLFTASSLWLGNARLAKGLSLDELWYRLNRLDKETPKYSGSNKIELYFFPVTVQR